MTETHGKSYAESLRAFLQTYPLKKKCCIFAAKDADKIAALPADERPEAIQKAAAFCKCPACLPRLIAGLFLHFGSVTDPSKRNHLEFSFDTADECDAVEAILTDQGFFPHRTVRKKQHILYLKGSEAITDFFAYIGANNAAFDFMNNRIEREFRNAVNRQVNCDTANIGKALKAAQEQMAVIQKLRDAGKLNLLPPNLKMTAELRMKYDQMSMKELGDAHEPPITKSGVSHRLTKIIDFARSIGIE